MSARKPGRLKATKRVTLRSLANSVASLHVDRRVLTERASWHDARFNAQAERLDQLESMVEVRQRKTLFEIGELLAGARAQLETQERRLNERDAAIANVQASIESLARTQAEQEVRMAEDATVSDARAHDYLNLRARLAELEREAAQHDHHGPRVSKFNVTINVHQGGKVNVGDDT